jgi:hypothetical protein
VFPVNYFIRGEKEMWYEYEMKDYRTLRETWLYIRTGEAPSIKKFKGQYPRLFFQIPYKLFRRKE